MPLCPPTIVTSSIRSGRAGGLAREVSSGVQRRHPRPRLSDADRRFWVLASRWFSDWRNPLLIVKPETVLGWERAGWRAYWSPSLGLAEIWSRHAASTPVLFGAHFGRRLPVVARRSLDQSPTAINHKTRSAVPLPHGNQLLKEADGDREPPLAVRSESGFV